MVTSSRLTASLSFLALIAGAAAQAPQLTGARALAAPDAVLAAFALRHATVQDLILPARADAGLRIRVELGDRSHALDLKPYDVRTPDFQLLVDDGKQLRRLPTPASTTFRGIVAGHAESLVAASLIGGQLWATVLLDGTTWGIEPLSARMAGMPVTAHVVYKNADVVVPANASCGTDDLHVPTEPTPKQSPTALQQAEIAIDCDLEYYQRNGSSVTNTQAAVTRIMNGVDAIYQRDVEIAYKVTTILVRTTRTYSNTDMQALLPEFRARWNSQHGNIKRDVAHLFTGKGGFSGIVGIAYLSVICNLSVSYGVDKAFSNQTTNVGLVAHELGHNWSAPHCDSSSPCNIMCSGLGGCSNNLSSFAPVSKSTIINFRNSRNCLDPINGPKPGKFTPFGTGCGGSNGTPAHTAFGLPRIGQGAFYSVNNTAINSTAWIVIGKSKTQFGTLSLPFDLRVIGAAGCIAYCDHLVVLGGATGPFGGRTVIFQFPNDRTLIDSILFTQFFVRDPAANTLGLTTSNAIETLLGG